MKSFVKANMADSLVYSFEKKLISYGIPEEIVKDVGFRIYEPYKSDCEPMPRFYECDPIKETQSVFVVAIYKNKITEMGWELIKDGPELSKEARSDLPHLLNALVYAKAYQQEFGKKTDLERQLSLKTMYVYYHGLIYQLFREERARKTKNNNGKISNENAMELLRKILSGQVRGGENSVKSRRQDAADRDTELDAAWDLLPESKRHHGAGVALAQAHQKKFPGRELGEYPGQRTYDKHARKKRNEAQSASN